ncbi:KH domain-containing, RNA-binding, signal transduction-associated protein 2 isoform X1 [Hydra vulgaris]|uniref:KH domain-containing, RNA-binding, signal transduction-associated protein 2 isoform X1 n=1 Tax=Hydra vulgaris TaxID=6087 RepID=UPI0032EA2D88
MSDTYLQELLEEKDVLNPDTHPHSIRLLEDEVLRVTGKTAESSGYISTQDEAEPSNNRKPRYKSYTGAVVNEEVVKLTEKVVVPVKEYPKFNFVGKLLGPRDNTLKRLQQATQTRMSVLGRGSTRDKAKEEELRNSGESKYDHLKEPLHVLIEVEGPKSEAHARLAAALAEIKKYMVPENDEIREEQMREMALLSNINPDAATAVMSGGRGRGFASAPIVRVGIPPPGAIILNGSHSLGFRGGRVSRVITRGGRRSLSIPRHASTAPDRYAYDAYDTTYDASYEGYPDSGEAVYYEYSDEYLPTGSTPHGNKRPAVGASASFLTKKYRSAEGYGDVMYPKQDSEPY